MRVGVGLTFSRVAQEDTDVERHAQPFMSNPGSVRARGALAASCGDRRAGPCDGRRADVPPRPLTDAAQTLPTPDRPTTLGVVVAPGPDRDRNLAGADYVAMPNEELPLADLAGRVLAHCGFRVVDAAPQSAETPDATLTIRARGNSIGGRYGEMRVGFTGADLTGDLVLDGGGYIHAARFSAVLYPSLLYPTPGRDGLTAAQPVAATFLAVLAGDGRPAPDSAEVWRPILEGTVYLDALIDLAADACGTAGLARAAYDAMPALRSRAIDRLAVRAAGDPEARAALLARLDDPDPDVHRDIADAVAAGRRHRGGRAAPGPACGRAAGVRGARRGRARHRPADGHLAPALRLAVAGPLGLHRVGHHHPVPGA